MRPLSKRLLALTLSASLVAAQLPARAAGGATPPPVDPAAAMKFFRDQGVIRNDADPIKSYLASDGKLTPIGETLYRSLVARYNPREEVEALAPTFDKLRQQGPYDAARQEQVQRAMARFNEQFKELNAPTGGDLEDAFREGTLREALLSGAQASDPPKADRYMQVQNGEEFEFWDKDGLAFRVNKNKVTTYNRDLQKTQKLMNATRPADVPFIPETGRYSYPMFQFSGSRLRTQFQGLERSLRVDRMIGFAELLGMQLRDDQIMSETVDPTLEADLINKAKAKTYRDGTQTRSVFDIVDKKFDQRRLYLYGGNGGIGAKGALDNFERDMKSYEGAAIVTDAQVASMSLAEQTALRWLSLGVLETQMHFVRGQIERVDPSSPDTQALSKALEESNLTPDQQRAYREQGEKMAARLKELRLILEGVRNKLSASDYAAGMEMSQSALAASQKELSDLSVDYSLYLESATGAWLAKTQLHGGDWLARWSPIHHGFRGTARLILSDYGSNMSALERNLAAYTDITATIAGADLKDPAKAREAWAKARADMMRLAPGDGSYHGQGGAPGADGKVTDAVRISSALSDHRKKITAVTETNKWIDTAAGFATWSLSLALGAPILRPVLNGFGRATAYAGASIMRAVRPLPLPVRIIPGLIGRGLYASGEVMRHVASRLETLEPGKQWLGERSKSVVGQYMYGIVPRMGSAMVRQGVFTGLSGVISGGFTLGTHFYDQASLRVGDAQIISKGHSPFSEDASGAGEAFMTGLKGGVWWANESFHPALGYVGLPSTAFRGSWVSGFMETLGARGVVGTTMHTFKAWRQGPGVVQSAGQSTRGLLERMAEAGGPTGFGRVQAAAGKSAAFTLSMADNVAKYALFSHGVGWLGQQYAWHVKTTDLSLPIVGDLGTAQPDVERRIKTANAAGMAWLMSPAWLLLPVHAGHAARDASPYQRALEGMKQFDAEGRSIEYALVQEGGRMRFLKPNKPPIAARIFEFRMHADAPPDYWIVTKEAKMAGLYKHAVRQLAGPGGKAADIAPLEALRMLRGKEGSRYIDIYINDETRAVAQELLIDAMLARPKQVLEVLDPKNLGKKVEGFGIVRPDLQLELATILVKGEAVFGRQVPSSLLAKTGELLKHYREAEMPAAAGAKRLTELLKNAPAPTSGLEKAIEDLGAHYEAWFTKSGQFKGKSASYDQMLEGWRKIGEEKVKSGEMSRFEFEVEALKLDVKMWGAGKGEFAKLHYTDLMTQMRARVQSRVDAKAFTQAEADALTGMYDYVLAVEKRLNSFNSTGSVQRQAETFFTALKTEYAASPKMLKAVADIERDLTNWASGRGANAAADGAGRSGESFKVMISNMGKTKRAHQAGLSAEEAAAVDKLIQDVKASPWVVHDSKGAALSGWRKPQFVSLFESLSTIVQTGRAGKPIRVFQMLTTGGGKTMMTFEGLLPLAEADAAANGGRKVMFLTVQSNLEAQARLEFIAYRKIDSTLSFDTYEGFKSKIAEGKTKGKNALEDYWILGDEMDGAALQPALTIGQVSGYVTRKNGVGMQIEEVDKGILYRLDRLTNERGSRALTEARRIQSLASDLLPLLSKDVAELIGKRVANLERAAGRLRTARSPQERAAVEAEINALINGKPQAEGLITALRQNVPSKHSEVVDAIEGSAGRIRKALEEAPALGAEFKKAMMLEMREGFASQKQLLELLETEAGLGRLAREAGKSRLALDARIERLEAELKTAMDRMQRPGAADAAGQTKAKARVESLAEDLRMSRLEKSFVERFEAADGSSRLMRVQRELSALEGAGETSGPRHARLTREKAALTESMTPEMRLRHEGYGESLARVEGLSRQMAEKERQILAAEANGDAALAAKRRQEYASLETDRATARGQVKTREVELGRADKGADLGAMLKRIETLEADAARMEGLVSQSNASGSRAGPMAKEAAAARKEAASLRRTATAEIHRRFAEAGDEIVALVEKGGPGWEAASRRLVERRKALLDAYGGDESAMYQAYREMKKDAAPMAENQSLLQGARDVKDGARQLKSFAEELAAYDAAPKGPPGEAMPMLAELARNKSAIEARVATLESRMAEYQAQPKRGKLQGEVLTRELEMARAELMLVNRYLAVESRAGTVPASVELVHMVSALDRLISDSSRIEGEVAAALRAKIDGKPWWWFLSRPGGLVKAAFGRPSGFTVEEIGLTRVNALRMLKALGKEPMMPLHQRDALFQDFALSLLFPRGPTHRGGSWVHNEVVNMIFGFHESAAGVRVDNKAKRFNVVHNGQWFESMDNPGRRWWELEYGVDITLPYTHDSISTIKDVTTYKNGRFISLSGTAGQKFVRHLLDVGVIKSGIGSQMPEVVFIDPVVGQGARITRIRTAIDAARARSQDFLLLTPADLADSALAAKYPGARKAIESYAETNHLPVGDNYVVEISKVKGADAQGLLREVRAKQGDTGLVVLSVSDTRVLKDVLHYLERVVGYKPEQIAKVFSDTEFLRQNVGEAKVIEQMNLGSLDKGKVKVLILDSRVGGRGLDLNFKGDRANPAPEAFRGYTNFEMLVIDPHEMSQVHLLQSFGRIDANRILSGATRRFSLVMDMKGAIKEPVFSTMFENDAFFVQMRRDPAVQRFAMQRGQSSVDLATIHEFMAARADRARKAGASDMEIANLLKDYHETVRASLEKRQAQIEAEQLRSSSVLQDHPNYPSRNAPLELLRR